MPESCLHYNCQSKKHFNNNVFVVFIVLCFRKAKLKELSPVVIEFQLT